MINTKTIPAMTNSPAIPMRIENMVVVRSAFLYRWLRLSISRCSLMSMFLEDEECGFLKLLHGVFKKRNSKRSQNGCAIVVISVLVSRIHTTTTSRQLIICPTSLRKAIWFMHLARSHGSGSCLL
jgi:hypothetical protein